MCGATPVSINNGHVNAGLAQQDHSYVFALVERASIPEARVDFVPTRFSPSLLNVSLWL